MKKSVMIGSFVSILIVIGALMIGAYAFNAIQDNKIKKDLNKCIVDSDCMIVPYSSCCGATKMAINKKYLEAYNNHKEWHSYYGPLCPMMGACADDTNVISAICRQGRIDGRCQMVFPHEEIKVNEAVNINCTYDEECASGEICYYSMTCPKGGACGPQKGDLKCHKTCNETKDCKATYEKCLEVIIARSDYMRVNKKICL